MNERDYTEEYRRRLDQHHPRSSSYQRALDQIEPGPLTHTDLFYVNMARADLGLPALTLANPHKIDKGEA